VNTQSLCLVLLCGETLGASLLRTCASGDLEFQSMRLLDQRSGGFMGFHDWLRGFGEDHVVGVRWWPHDSSYVRLPSLCDKPYLDVHEGKGVSIWFSTTREFDSSRSGDQAFGLSRILISENGAVALALDTDDLTEPELLNMRPQLKFVNARWL
jgi:hypothetical protein